MVFRLVAVCMALCAGFVMAQADDVLADDGFAPSDAYGLLDDLEPYYAQQQAYAQPAQPIRPRRVIPPQRTLVVPVPRITIYPGDRITEDMLLDFEYMPDPRQRRPVFAQRHELLGKISRHTLLPQRPIPPGAIREPYAIKQGEAVRAYFSVDGLKISMTAVPLESGSIGDVISLRNQESGTTIRGVVQQDGSVRVGMQ